MTTLDDARGADTSLPEDATLLIVDDDEPFSHATWSRHGKARL